MVGECSKICMYTAIFVGVVALRYQHHSMLCGADNGVPQLPQT